MPPQRLPIVDSDDGVWGDIIRQYLKKEHYDDGTDNAANGGHQFVTIRAGTTSAAPLTLTSGSLRTTPAIGSIEFNNDTLYFTQTTGTTRMQIVTDGGIQTLSNKTLSSPTFSGSYSFGGTPTWPTFNQNTTGSAATLTTARTFQTNLASTSTATFNGSANVTPGVTGTLGVANGGTGRATATTAYGIIAAGTTATGVQQTIAPGSAGQFLKSAGASALASFASIQLSDLSDSSSVVTLTGGQTLTNKTINASNNTISNIAVSNLAAAAVVTESEGISSNDNDTTLPTSAAVKDYVDSSGAANSQAKFMTGTVATASATAAKTVTLDAPWASVAPASGDFLFITFTSGTAVSSATLAVNGGTAYPIRTIQGQTSSTYVSTEANAAVLMYFDGTYYRPVAAPTNSAYSTIADAEIINTGSTAARLITGQRAEYLMANEASVARTLTNKTIDAASNTLSNIPQSAVTNLTTDLAGKAATSHTHTAANISDSTTVGRSVLTAADAAAARTAIGAGTGSGDVTLTGAQTLTNKTLTSPVLNGTVSGTGVSTATTANTLALRDANGNLSANALLPGFTTTATAAGTTTLTITSDQVQVFTGTSTQTVRLPTTGVIAGGQYRVINNSTGAVTVQSSAGNQITILAPNTSGLFMSLQATPTASTHWDGQYWGTSTTAGKVLSVSNTLTLAGTDGTTMTFPSSSGNVVTEAATQTLTGKTLSSPTFSGSYSFGGTPTWPTFNQNTTGSAATLTTARTVQTNLGSTSSASFNGSANITPGVTGTLGVANGGTGATTLTGLVKGNGTGAMTAATAGTDYVTPTGSETLSNKTLTTPVINGTPTGTGVASAATASTLVLRDSNGNVSANAFVHGFTTTATAAGTTTLTITSDSIQEFTGTSTQTVRLPTTSIVAGARYTVINSSTGNVTVQSSGANTISTLPGGTSATFTALVATPTTAANWESTYIAVGGDASTNTASSVDNEVVLFSGTGGKTLKRATTTGIAKLTSGVLSAATAGTDYVTPAGSETLSNKTLSSPTFSGSYSFGGTPTWPTFNQNTTGSAATLTTARTIGLSGGATGTATSFNGSANITIPVTALNADSLSAGTLPDARMTGTYTSFTHRIDGANTVFTTPNSGSTNNLGRTVYGLAEYRSSSASQTGAIVFYAPNTTSSIMHQLEISGLLYNQNIVQLTVQGYRTTGAWNDTRKISTGTVDVQVRWGVDPSGKNCLILGDVGTSWSYPHLSIVRAMFSHTGTSDAYATGWTVGVVTDLTGYTQVTSDITDSAMVGSISGNAATATTLQTARTIGGVSFNGSANINLPGVNTTGNQNTTGSAATLTTARTIQTNLASTSSSSFNGSANVTPGVTGTLPVGNGGTGATTLTGIIKGNGSAAFTAATAGTDYVTPAGNETLSNKTISGSSGNTFSNIPQSAVTNLTTDLAGKADAITGAATTIANSNLTASRAVVSDTSGKIAVSVVTSTEIGYLDGVTSSIQTQLNGKAATSHTHTASQISDSTATGRSVLTAANAAAARSAIGAGTGDGDVTLNGAQTLTNKTLTNPTVNNYTEGVIALGTVSTSATLNLTNGTIITATLTASTTCTFTMPTATAGKSFVLMLKQAASTGNGNAVFSGVKWNGSGAPTITSTAGKMDIISFFSDGSNWYGSYTQGYTP